MRLRRLLFAAAPLAASRLGAASDVLVPRGVGDRRHGPGRPVGRPRGLHDARGRGLRVAGVWFLWRGRRQSGGRASKGKLSVAETRSLGNRQYLVVAAYGEKKYLIGVCVGRISLLAPLDDVANPPSA
jgi:flagellar protein FliO/FliZ